MSNVGGGSSAMMPSLNLYSMTFTTSYTYRKDIQRVGPGKESGKIFSGWAEEERQERYAMFLSTGRVTLKITVCGSRKRDRKDLQCLSPGSETRTFWESRKRALNTVY